VRLTSAETRRLREYLDEAAGARLGGIEPKYWEIPRGDTVFLQTISKDQYEGWLSEWQEAIRNEPFEHAFVIDARGGAYHVTSEDIGYVWLQQIDCKGALVVHNHTDNTTFSSLDFDSMKSKEMRELRIVSSEYDITMVNLEKHITWAEAELMSGVDTMCYNDGNDARNEYVLKWLDTNDYITYKRAHR